MIFAFGRKTTKRWIAQFCFVFVFSIKLFAAKRLYSDCARPQRPQLDVWWTAIKFTKWTPADPSSYLCSYFNWRSAFVKSTIHTQGYCNASYHAKIQQLLIYREWHFQRGCPDWKEMLNLPSHFSDYCLPCAPHQMCCHLYERDADQSLQYVDAAKVKQVKKVWRSLNTFQRAPQSSNIIILCPFPPDPH